ncbi:MAG TPA: GDSL-type esterase/lipase family protein [Kofleriaceae bacterium]|nr:GDSL-type esterase/lipase family protein [Kofleriaceae bacterium]
MPRSVRRLWLAQTAIVLAGCGGGSGCDGERGKPPIEPRPPTGSNAGAGSGGASEPKPPDEVPASIGFLDAPAGTLEPLFRALDAAERRDPSGRTLLVFFGDSHTSGDAMTSRLRVVWQNRFGDAGRGLVAAGRPKARHYYQRDVRYGASGAWRSAIGGTKDPEPFGIAGLRVYGDKKGAQLWVETCAECKAGTAVSQFELLYHAAPDRGILRYRVDEGPWQQLSAKTTQIEPPHPARHVIPVVDGPHRLTLEHGGGGMLDFYGVVMERPRPGVIVDSLGVVGRRLSNLRSWDWSVIGEQLATRDPRLVVLQYGTNESDDTTLDLDALAQQYDDMIRRIRAAAPSAAILVLGPPDIGVREGGAACDRVKPGKPGAGAGTGAGVDDAGVDDVIPECQWRTPGIIRDIISVEHAAAVRNRVAFFDTFAAMGGADQMDRWFVGEPKLAFKDRVHFTELGYQRWADQLSNALLAAYASWRRSAGPRQPPPPPPLARPGDRKP